MYVFNYFGYRSRRVAGSYSNSMFNPKEPDIVFQNHHLIFLPAVCEGSNFSASLPTLTIIFHVPLPFLQSNSTTKSTQFLPLFCLDLLQEMCVCLFWVLLWRATVVILPGLGSSVSSSMQWSGLPFLFS